MTTKVNIHEQLKWLGTILMFCSALSVSFVVEWSTQAWAFSGFFLGHIIWSTYAMWMKEWSLFALNFVFLFIDTYAIYIRL